MPLRLLRHSALTRAAWDACLAAARPAALPYAEWWWLQATAGRWDAVVELDEATGAYRSVLPLPVKWRPWGREVYQPPFTQQLGLLTTAASQHRHLPDYLALLPGRYARFYQQLHTAQELTAAPPGFSLTHRHTYQLSLAAPYAELLAGYTAEFRRRLRHNQKQPEPLVVTEAAGVKELIALFRREKGRAAGLRERHYGRLRHLVAELQDRQLAWALQVRHPATGQLLAGALFVRHTGGLIYLLAAASAEGKKAHGPQLLLDHVIRHGAGTPGLVLDFEGGMIPSIARFFANFGAAPVPYAALSFTSQRPWYLQWMR
ncbi:GNAT family N-acetyltransferase [Hymenobacter weizhouensis]|uniref:GNAT family N-acetyltransferase n=1 Tax=Hymenobacter sp. YIM 151500-1 TaxID=2987689 RepID=UPI00222727D7|nr:GNAT family N-acetyltransferase [Hymenobacter sp. YIM 151500-1]UYZ61744.1 GNAT family N-acetyltransferase [Hymenobacter sp. YIM 151500-1]